jgi:hypothetical protein
MLFDLTCCDDYIHESTPPRILTSNQILMIEDGSAYALTFFLLDEHKFSVPLFSLDWCIQD